MTFLTFDGVSHHYFTKHGVTKALEDVSFSIKEGEFISILGPSGCGKSTILSVVSGLITQTRGKVFVKEQTVKQSSLRIGYMLQQDYLFPWKTILNNVLIGPKVDGRITKSMTEKGEQLLKEVGLTKVANDYPDALSGGMRQRVAFVRTFMSDPHLLLLDEPFSALDYLTKLKLEDLVNDLLRRYNKTAILVTHDISEAIAMSDRIFVMGTNPGTINKTFTIPDELRKERPFLVRRHPEYQRIFDEIWLELNQGEKTFLTTGTVTENGEN